MACSKGCKDSKAVEICCGAPNSRTDLSRLWVEDRHIVGHVEEILLFNKFFPIVDNALVSRIQPDKVVLVRWSPDGVLRHFCVLHIFSELRAAHVRPAF